MGIATASALEFEACNSAINRVCGAYRVRDGKLDKYYLGDRRDAAIHRFARF